MDKILNALIVTILIYSTKCSDSTVCVQKSPCLCEFSEYSKIDISNATQKDRDPIKAEDFLKDELNGTIFYFHGCTDGIFNLKDHGINSNSTLRGSLIVQSKENATVLGTSSQIKFHQTKNDDFSYELLYSDKGNITASIRLICDNFNQPFIKAFSSNTSNEQKLVLSSPHVCIVTHHPGLSTGSVLVILFFIASGIYFIGGAVILYFIRGARGLELIPNIDFWRQLPGLVKDGIIFLFSGCSAHAISTPESYDRI